MKKTWYRRAGSTLLAIALILAFFPAGPVFALTRNETMTEGTTKTFDAPTYTSFTYQWSISTGSQYLSITSGTTASTCTVKATAPGNAVLKVVYTRGTGRLQRSYTNTYNIKVNEDLNKDKPMSREVLDAVGIDPGQLNANTALIYVDGTPTLFFLNETHKSYDDSYTYVLNSLKDGGLDQEIQLSIQNKQRQGMTVSTQYGDITNDYSMRIYYFNPFNEPYMFAYTSSKISSANVGNNKMTLTVRSDGLNHVEGVFTGTVKSKWSNQTPNLSGAFKLTFGEIAEQTRELYASDGGHLPDDEELKAMDREVFESYIESLKKAREERQQQRAVKTCKDCGGTGWCIRCAGYGKVVGENMFTGSRMLVECAHCQNHRICPTCHGSGQAR